MSKSNTGYRKHERLKTLVLLEVVSVENPNESGRAAVIDISVSGAAFESPLEFIAGEKVVLRFTLPKNRVYAIDGAVCRVRRRSGAFVYGVQFNQGSFFSRIRRRKFISKLSRIRQS